MLEERDRGVQTPQEAKRYREQLRRTVLTLWQTSMLRETKLTVLDEVTNGLSYYDYTFLRELPRLYCELEDQLEGYDPAGGPVEVPRSCASAAGSAATATAIPSSPPMCCARRVALHSSRALPLLSRGIARARAASCRSPAASCRCRTRLRRWSTASPDRSPQRQAEPYRRAICRASTRALAATAAVMDGLEAPHHAGGRSAALRPAPPSSRPISTPSTARCASTARACWRAGGCGCCAVRSTASASTSPASTCARTPTCMSASVAELLRSRGAAARLRGARRGTPAWRCCAASWRRRARWSRPMSTTPRRRRANWPSFRAAAEAHRALRRAPCIPHCDHLQGRVACPTCLEVAMLLKEVGLVPRANGRQRGQHRAAVRDHRRPAQRRGDHGRAARAARLPPPACAAAAARRR